MAQNSSISWTDHTYNPWWGCVKVSEECRNCYADTLSHRFGENLWGVSARRKFFGDKHWSDPVKWNTAAAKDGIRRRVFCASMADVFEFLPNGHPDVEAMSQARIRLWNLIEATPALDWLLLTKRPQNILNMTPVTWDGGFPNSVWIGTSVGTQETADERIPHLLKVPAAVRFLSAEPLLGPLDLTMALESFHTYDPMMAREPAPISWVITGGESQHGARPSHPDWFRGIRDQCAAAGVAYHHKQHGEWMPLASADEASHYPNAPMHTFDNGVQSVRVGKHAAGRLLDGQLHDAFPEVQL